MKLYQKAMCIGTLVLVLFGCDKRDVPVQRLQGDGNGVPIGLAINQNPAPAAVEKVFVLEVSIDALVSDPKYAGKFVRTTGKVLSAVPGFGEYYASAVLSGSEKWVRCISYVEDKCKWYYGYGSNQNEAIALLLAAKTEAKSVQVEGRYTTKGLFLYSVSANGVSVVLRER